ncbi:Protein of unknown function [Micromonospora coriariae]|uniref:SMODS and SLOG-associating 2TM effector domain-containing protein n=1 Tax=Micromonospora coriariae TaxID=285665 RepID=A0A1C4Y112_9ACTN|nr:Protein of unknown function [Micromonospora coriariae]
MLEAEDFPPFQRAVSRESQVGKKVFLRLSELRLLLLLLAAATGAVSWNINRLALGALVAACCFATASAVEVFLLTNRPNQRWYSGRALSESVKSLSWRYAVAADPFPRSRGERECAEDFTSRLLAMADDMVSAGLAAPAATGQQITGQMRALRLSSFQVRRVSYVNGRLEGQRVWYANQCSWHRARAKSWSVALLVLEIAGVVLAVLRVAGLTTVDLLGIAAAAIAAGVAYMQTRQYDSTAIAYALASQELAAIGSIAVQANSESKFSRLVNDAETAISREHTMWRARRR